MTNFTQYIKRGIHYILNGQPVVHAPVYAQISYLQPNALLKGKRIIITGGGRGLGYAMAKKFISEGAKVLIAGRNEEVLQQAAAQLGCLYLSLDVQDVSTFDSFFEQAVAKLGAVNCLVNNAGISLHESDFSHVSIEQYNRQFDTNLRGPFFLTQCFMDKCWTSDEKQTKNILFVSSETSMTADERPYGLSKAALNSLIQGLAHKYVNDGFRINGIAPGVTISDMVGGGNPNGDISYPQLTGRYYLPEEVAEVACFLLSDASNCINGQIILTNEGKTINARWK